MSDISPIEYFNWHPRSFTMWLSYLREVQIGKFINNTPYWLACPVLISNAGFVTWEEIEVNKARGKAIQDLRANAKL